MNKKITSRKNNKKIDSKIKQWKTDFDFVYLKEIIKSNIYIDRNIDFFEMLYFHIKKYFTSFTTIFLYFIPILFIIFLGTIAPVYLLTAGIYSSSLILSTFFVFSTCFFRIKSSSLIKYHKVKLKNLYISTMITVFISNILITIYTTLIIFILIQVGFIYNDWFFHYNIYFTEITTTFNSINWGLFVYFFFATTIITYLIALFFTLFVKSQAKFLFVTVFVLFYTFCFGGVIQFWFYASPIYDSTSYYDPSSNLIIVEPQILYEDRVIPFAFSLFCPFWYINVLTRFMFSDVSMSYNNFQQYLDLLSNNPLLLGSHYLDQGVKINYLYFDNILWDFVLFGSFIVISIYSFLIELFFIKKQIKMVKWFYYRSN